MKRFLSLGSVLALAFSFLLSPPTRPARAQTPPQSPTPAPRWDTYSDTWAGTYVGADGKPYPLPMYADVGPPKPGKTVGMFYFLWIDGRTGEIHNNADLLNQNPTAVIPYTHGAWHWWGQPLLGYYLNTDPFVLRKHAQMLSDAQVDALFFDSTNSYVHADQVDALCKVFTDVRRAGNTTPQIAHVTNAQSGKTIQGLYNDFYSKNLYSDLWFRWLGKPVILGHPAELTPQLNNYFTVRYSWAWANASGWFGNGQDKWPWLDNYPQKYGWHTDPSIPESMAVCIAQHATTSKGRSFHGGKEPPAAERFPNRGINFAEQWSQALKVSPQFVFVTGWNEWIAPIQAANDKTVFTGLKLKKGDAFFVDEYSPEFSRDAEPTVSDGLNDSYYYQLVNYVRRYKGVRPLPAVTPRPIKLTGPFAQWQTVGPEFRDDIGDPAHRDFDGFAKGSHYTNTTGRNDIVAAKVSYDAKNLYFYVRTHAKLTPHTDPDWMLLYLNTDGDYQTGWLGYDFVLNRHAGAATTTLEKNIGGAYQWQTVGEVKYHAAGSELVIAVPRALLGAGTLPASIDFKWADHCYAKGDWSDFTLNGDAAPNDRFSYRAKLRR